MAKVPKYILRNRSVNKQVDLIKKRWGKPEGYPHERGLSCPCTSCRKKKGTGNLNLRETFSAFYD